jgi:hypothetical protein
MSFLVNPYWYPSGCDPDAVAFLTAAGITDPTITSAICTLVISMKANGTWAKMNAIYPFVGGTASTHRWNLKDPRDLDAAFRLQFFGFWTHSANGALPNGTNAYCNSFLTPSVTFATNSHSFGIYSRTNNVTGNRIYGSFSTATQTLQHNLVITGGLQGAFQSGNSGFLYPINTTSLFVATRTSSTVFKAFRAGALLGSNATAMTSLPTFQFTFAARNSGTILQFTPHQLAFAFLGAGLSDAEAATLFTDVQAFQTTLSRNV